MSTPHGGVLGERAELIFALAVGMAYVAGVPVGWLTDALEGVSIALYLAAYAFGGFSTVREAVDSIRAGRFEVDFLMLVAAAGAAALGKWAEGAVLLFLVSLGHALARYAMGRARRAIEALAALAPKTALVRRDGVEQEMPVEQVQIGDVVIVRPNGRPPAASRRGRSTPPRQWVTTNFKTTSTTPSATFAVMTASVASGRKPIARAKSSPSAVSTARPIPIAIQYAVGGDSTPRIARTTGIIGGPPASTIAHSCRAISRSSATVRGSSRLTLRARPCA